MTRIGAAWRGAAIGALGVFVLGALGHCCGWIAWSFAGGPQWVWTTIGELVPFAVIGAIAGVGDYDVNKGAGVNHGSRLG